MKNQIAELIWRNPMLIDAKRFTRRFFGNKVGTVNIAVLVLAIVVYTGLLGLVASVPEISSLAVQTIQLFVFCFLMPSMLHGAIASEKEKRTWDFLASAPVTKKQIVIGKYLSGLAAMLAIVFLASLPIVFTAARRWIVGPWSDGESVWQVVGGELITITYAMSLGAFSLYVSTKAKRAFTALALIHVVQLFLLAVLPVFAGILFTGDSGRTFENSMALHPFIALFGVFDNSGNLIVAKYGGLFFDIGHLLIAFTFISLAIHSLSQESPD